MDEHKASRAFPGWQGKTGPRARLSARLDFVAAIVNRLSRKLSAYAGQDR
jgi:hypothetical protein